MTTATPRRSFREQMLDVRQEAILQATSQLLCQKTFAAMTMDDVADAVGIAKASLYKHFSSKDDLCCAAVVQMLAQVRGYLAALDPDVAPLDKLRAVVGWSLERLLAQEIPEWPGSHSPLRAMLREHQDCLSEWDGVSQCLEQWVTEAQQQGALDAALPPRVVLHILYARACDPAVGFLQDAGLYDDAEIVELVLRTSFDGLAVRHSTAEA